MRILLSGDRHWTNRGRIEAVLRMYTLNTPAWQIAVDVGDCAGFDRLAAAVCDQLGIRAVHVHEANWGRHDLSAGPIRNRAMLKRYQDLVLALHDDLSKSKGTKDVVNEARRRGHRVLQVTQTEIVDFGLATLPGF